MADKKQILAALDQLDPLDDDHWTSDGAPRIEAVQEILGGKNITRKDIVEAAPKLTRETAGQETPAVSAQTLAKVDQPLTEQEFAHFLGSVPKEELEDVLAILRLQLGEASKSVKEAQELEARIKRSISFTESRIKSEYPNSTDRDATRAFIETQTRLRAERVAKRQEILGKIDPSELDPRAPIDRAMARKTKRGGQRPIRQLVK